MQRNYNAHDQFIFKLQQLNHILRGNIQDSPRPSPAIKQANTTSLSEHEQRHVAALMRVNHSGEVCAQALYDSQAVFSRNTKTKRLMQQAAIEEYDHLHWCQQRIHELNSHVSYLNPLWYCGSWLIGAIAACAGDRWNLGFVAATEQQVTTHLEKHRNKIPSHDHKTHAVLKQMQQDETEHAQAALHAGGHHLASFIQTGMTIVSKVMTTIAYYI